MQKKAVIAVLLDEMVCSPIMSKQLEQAQIIEYKDCKTDGACCVKLLQMEDIKKCLEEEKYSNSEFSSARIGIENKLNETKKELPELEYFMEKFLPAFDLTLDQQQEI